MFYEFPEFYSGAIIFVFLSHLFIGLHILTLYKFYLNI